MRRLKADLHAHCGDDPSDALGYSAEMLIEASVQLNYDVLAIACHEALVYSPGLAAYAARRGLLLVPAVELNVEGKHVVVLNPDADHLGVDTFDRLRAVGRRDGAILAPHPFYGAGFCLGRALEQNVDLFDAVEYSMLYCRGYNPNGKAVRLAERYGLPLIGTSDAHGLPAASTTFTWIDAAPAVDQVIEAVRAGRVQLETTPLSWGAAASRGYYSVRHYLGERIHGQTRRVISRSRVCEGG